MRGLTAVVIVILLSISHGIISNASIKLDVVNSVMLAQGEHVVRILYFEERNFASTLTTDRDRDVAVAPTNEKTIAWRVSLFCTRCFCCEG